MQYSQIPGKIHDHFQSNQYRTGLSNTQLHPTDRYGNASTAPQHEMPNFSPFPPLRYLPPNVPPTDEEKEATLEAAREAVLRSSDPEVQLTWAQDALLYVDISMQNEQRISATQPPRSRTPRVEHMLREDAMKVVDFLADQHHPRAEFIRGMWLDFGKFGQRMDKKEAFHCYTRAAEKGYARAYYRIGMQFEASSDALKAIRYYQKGADASDSACCYRLGMMALLGQHGQPQDYERGLNLIHQSAQTADENAPQGAYVFGMLQAQQLPQVNVPERFLAIDIPDAKTNIEKAAFLGFSKAQVKMGAAYELCELGCDFNPALSLHYNALAARQGEPEAEMAISKWFLCGHEGVFEKNEEMAFTYAQRAAVSGMATAQFAMGYFYEVGIYVPVNFKEAKEWYARAAGNGNKEASTRIDSISRSKTLSRKDHEHIALSRIRQYHGSQGENLAAISESGAATPLDMPDPSRLTLNPDSQPQYRPHSAAPYPTDSMPPRTNIHGQGGNYSNPERPTSAFGINPNLRPTAAAAIYSPRRDEYGRGGYASRGRPYPLANMSGAGRGRGVHYPTAPSSVQGHGTSGRGQTRPPINSPGQTPQNQLGGPPAPPLKIDIGYSAPLEVAAPGRRQRLSPHNPSSGKAQPHTPLSATQPPPLPRKSVPVQSTLQNRYYSSHLTQDQTLEGLDVKPANITPSQPSPTPTPSAPTKPSRVSANTKIPGKGPRTFGEMGVPAGKQESECVSRVNQVQTTLLMRTDNNVMICYLRSCRIPGCMIVRRATTFPVCYFERDRA